MECEDSSASREVGKSKGRNEKNKMDIIGISEVRWQQSGELISDEFRMFYSSGDAKGNHGVSVVLGPRVRALSHTPALPVPVPAPAPDAMLSNGVFHT